MTTAIKERPILFSGPMVRAILDGSKTQTRRIMKPQPLWSERNNCWLWDRKKRGMNKPDGATQEPPYGHNISMVDCLCPYGHPGDRLWVRETFDVWTRGGGEYPHEVDRYESELAPKWETDEHQLHPKDANLDVIYRADLNWNGCTGHAGGYEWRPSIHMPRWASRITLEITGVRVERLQEIGRQDAKAEGFLPGLNGLEKWNGKLYGNAQLAFEACWNDINKTNPWDSNPWVWVLELKRIDAAGED